MIYSQWLFNAVLLLFLYSVILIGLNLYSFLIDGEDDDDDGDEGEL